MRLAHPLVGDISGNPIARAVIACVLLVTSVAPLVGVSFADNYVNGGVAWDNGSPAPSVPLADVDPMGVNLFLEKEPDRANVVKSLDIAAGRRLQVDTAGFRLERHRDQRQGQLHRHPQPRQPRQFLGQIRLHRGSGGRPRQQHHGPPRQSPCVGAQARR